ncbi:hypothetical protein Tco_0705984 [Tanacetum coccineum]|uniref:Uncharacterized protein n=1 Tax=Tanacetum coccineum TaxID=301880 RepID=A0ABQ4Y867_9ASTR
MDTGDKKSVNDFEEEKLNEDDGDFEQFQASKKMVLPSIQGVTCQLYILDDIVLCGAYRTAVSVNKVGEHTRIMGHLGVDGISFGGRYRVVLGETGVFISSVPGRGGAISWQLKTRSPDRILLREHFNDGILLPSVCSMECAKHGSGRNGLLLANHVGLSILSEVDLSKKRRLFKSSKEFTVKFQDRHTILVPQSYHGDWNLESNGYILVASARKGRIDEIFLPKYWRKNQDGKGVSRYKSSVLAWKQDRSFTYPVSTYPGRCIDIQDMSVSPLR